MAVKEEWYYAKGGEQIGPVSSAELKRLASIGELSANDLVWKESMADWKQAKAIKGLFVESKPLIHLSSSEPSVSVSKATRKQSPKSNTASKSHVGHADAESTVQQVKRHFWQRLPLAAVFTVFCWPVGMLLVWINPHLTWRSKQIWTGVSLAAFLLLSILVPKSDDQSSNKGSPSSGTFEGQKKAHVSSLIPKDAAEKRPRDPSPADYAYDYSKDDFKSIPDGATRHTRTRPIDTPGADKELLGKLDSEEGYLDSKGNFVEHGPFTTWADQAMTKKFRTGTMLNGKVHGVITFFADNGTKVSELPIVQGQRHGIERHWYDSGKKKSEHPYLKGRQDGLSTGWYETGQKKYENHWKNGVREGESLTWLEDGGKEAEENYQNGFLHGPYVAWDKSGVQTHLGQFESGLKTGEWKRGFPACDAGRACPRCGGKPYTVTVNADKWGGGSTEEFLTLLHLLASHGLQQTDRFSPRHGRPSINWTIYRATLERVFGPPQIGPSSEDEFGYSTYGYSCSDGDVTLRSQKGILPDGKGTRIVVFRDF